MVENDQYIQLQPHPIVTPGGYPSSVASLRPATRNPQPAHSTTSKHDQLPPPRRPAPTARRHMMRPGRLNHNTSLENLPTGRCYAQAMPYCYPVPQLIHQLQLHDCRRRCMSRTLAGLGPSRQHLARTPISPISPTPAAQDSGLLAQVPPTRAPAHISWQRLARPTPTSMLPLSAAPPKDKGTLVLQQPAHASCSPSPPFSRPTHPGLVPVLPVPPPHPPSLPRRQPSAQSHRLRLPAPYAPSAALYSAW
jgi:hypothetical protein